jgi:hypothetical protein
MPKGVHYGHVLTSIVADCINSRQRWDILKRRKKTIRVTPQPGEPNQPGQQRLQLDWRKQFSKKVSASLFI